MKSVVVHVTDQFEVLQGLQSKQILLPQTVVELEECLRERDVSHADPALTELPVNGIPSKASTPHGGKLNGAGRLDKRQIEQRIEEDRERHKRLRESIWAVSSEEDREFDRLWDDTSDIGDDDLIAAEEDAIERKNTIEVD